MNLACLALFPLALQVPPVGSLEDLTWLDVDADGRMDLVVVGPNSGLRLLRNLGRDGFADETALRGLADLPPVRDVLAADTDGDGAVDLVLTDAQGMRLLRQAHGTFVDATKDAGLDALVEVASVDRVDANRDGRADLHVVAGGRHRIFASLPSGAFGELDLDLSKGAMQAEAFGASSKPIDAGMDPESAQRPPVDAAQDAQGHAARRPALAAPGGTAVSSNRVSVSTDPASTGGPNGGTAAVTGLGACSPAISDVATVNCLQTSSNPTVGTLYPLGSYFFIDGATGHVGVGTLTPAYSLHVPGRLVSGTNNFAYGNSSAVGGGRSNVASEEDSVVAGGERNRAQETGTAIGGGAWNLASAEYSVIGGGGDGTELMQNRTESARSVIAGGAENVILELIPFVSADGAVIGGGISNEIAAYDGPRDFLDADFSTIRGGASNFVGGYRSATIGGGVSNSIRTFGALNLTDGTISGGVNNDIEQAGAASIGGGANNSIRTGSPFAVVAGGENNVIRDDYGVVSGGAEHSADGRYAVVPGGLDNDAGGDDSLAAGRRAQALHNGAFVWGDETDADFASTGDSQFLVRASGGVGIGTDAPTAGLHVVADAGLSDAVRAVADSGGIGAITQGGANGAGLVASGDAQAGFFVGEVELLGGSDVGLSGGAFLQCGDITGPNVAIDSNEIMARNNGNPADLSLNIEGGNVEMIASGSGRVGIGTNGPAAKLDVYGESSADIFRARVNGTTRLVLDGNGGLAVGAKFTPSYDLEISSLAPNGGTAAKPGGGSWSSSSDRRLKKNIGDLDGALDTLLALRGVTFEYKDPASINELEGTRIGFIAQEVEEVLSDWVGEKPDGMKMVTVRGFEALMVEALREQQRVIAAQDKEVAARAERISRRDAELAELRALIESRQDQAELFEELRSEVATLLDQR